MKEEEEEEEEEEENAVIQKFRIHSNRFTSLQSFFPQC